MTLRILVQYSTTELQGLVQMRHARFLYTVMINNVLKCPLETGILFNYWFPMCGFIAQLVEHCTGIRGGHGFEYR